MLPRPKSQIFPARHEAIKQALSMRRFAMAAGSSLLVIGLLFVCHLLDVLSKAAFYQSAALVALPVLAFYLVFRTGLNQRCRDPNLTLAQMLTSSSVILYTMYMADGGRMVLLVVLLMIFLFGVLRLALRALLMYAAAILAAYGAVIGLLWRFRPQSLDLHLELLQWLALMLTLPWFAAMGGYIGELRKKQEKLNRTLRLLSDCNAVLVRAVNETDLLNDLCRLVVESGGFVMGWVGIAQHDAAKTVRAVAQSGHEEGYLENVRISWDGAQEIGRGPTGTAIRTGATQVNRNCVTNPDMAPWREAALMRGYQSSAALPLLIGNEVLGAFTLYAATPGSFKAANLRLLEELAGNMAYGMQSLRIRSELERSRLELEERVARRTGEIAALNNELVAKASEAEVATHAKSAFLSTMSHEIRTPLNAVLGLAGLLSDSPLDRRQRDYADKLELSAQALRVLVDDILDFSKIEAGALKLEQVPFSLNAIMRTTAAVVSIGLRDKPIEALFDVAPDLPDNLIGDPVRLQQILLNLTGNAIKFTAAGEMVVAVRCRAAQNGHVTLEFAVRDTGIGIPAEQLGQIFDTFDQADTSITRQYGGTGLGLSISARLVELMGGQIRVDSLLGRGSEFSFSVTLGVAHGTPPSARTIVPPALNILIVDDHALSRAILQRSCTGFGWQATALGSGQAGLDELRKSGAEGRDYDVMLLDWRMPGMDGIEMLRQAYGDPDIGLPQVILMASIVELEQAAAASDDLYLDGIAAKPITPASLLETVTRAQAGDFTAICPEHGKADRRLAGWRLLVVEDNPINQQVIEHILVRAGADVVIAGGALAAFDALRPPQARFDAILMDIQMPHIDGHAATRIVRQEMGWLDLPVIAVTAHAGTEECEKSRRAGMAGHLVKPIDIEDLLDIVGAGRRVPAAAASAQACPACMPAFDLPGVDLGAALKAFGGDSEKYLKLLRQFITLHAGDVDSARRLFQGADRQGAARLLHGLRGMASLLQAGSVAGLTAAAARALRDGQADTVLPLFDQLDIAMLALGAACDAIKAGAA